LIILAIPKGMAQNHEQEILIAGFAFGGDFSSKAVRYPYFYHLDEELKITNSSISREISNRLKHIHGSHYSIASGRTFSTKSTDSPLNGILLLTGETVLVENYGSYWKVFINIRGDALLFNYKEKKIIKTYPLNLAIFDAIESQYAPTKQQIINLIKANIFTLKKEGLISQFVEKISKATAEQNGEKIFQVGNITIMPEALNKFPLEIRNNPSVAKDIVADALSSELSGQNKISLMPAKFNNALGLITMQLEDTGEQIELKIGDGDYIFNIEVNKLAKAKQQQTNSEVSYIYGVNASIQVIEPFSKTVFMESIFRNGAVSISPINKITHDDYPAYYDVINGLFKKFSLALKTRDYKWVNVATGSEKTAEQMKQVSNLLDGKGN
jgi:hypothetical protein